MSQSKQQIIFEKQITTVEKREQNNVLSTKISTTNIHNENLLIILENPFNEFDKELQNDLSKLKGRKVRVTIETID